MDGGRLVVWSVLWAVLAAGCGSKGGLVPAQGTVFIDGKPLTRGTIRVAPDEPQMAISPIGPDGTFRLSSGNQPGFVPGLHKVEVVAVEDTGNNKQRWLVPKKYALHATSGLTIEIPAGGSKSLVINLIWDGSKPFEETLNTGPIQHDPLEVPPPEN